MKSKIIRRNQAEIHPVPLALHGKLMASAVQMAVKAPAHLIFGKQFQNFRTFVALIPGRIM